MNLRDRFASGLSKWQLPNLNSMIAGFASAFEQRNRFITLQIGDGKTYGDLLLPQYVEGREELSTSSRYEVTCLSMDAYLLPERIEGQSAQINIVTNDGQPALGAPGKITRCGLITEVEALPSDGGFARYRLVVESPLALLAHRRTNRVFQDLSVPEIVGQIWDEHIADNPAIRAVLQVQFVLRRRYAPRSYCIQQHESDFAFISRLLAEEGITFYWRSESGDTPKCIFVAFDDPYDLPEAAQGKIRFHRADATETEDSLTEWTGFSRIGPSRSSMRSYNYKTTYTDRADADSRVTLPKEDGRGEEPLPVESTLEDYSAMTLYYGKDQEELSRYATLRQNVHDRKKRGYHATGNVRQLLAGEWFCLENHPAFGGLSHAEREFVVCELAFEARNNLPGGLTQYLRLPQGLPGADEAEKNQDAPYRVRLGLRKRGLPLTPAYAHTEHDRPTAPGVQSATVVGPKGEEVYTDDMGRIRVQFHWQRPSEHAEFGANYDERSSCWVRVAYPSAGTGWGSQYIPRVGQEVLVDFIDGDADRPIVTHVVHNGTRVNPLFSNVGQLPANRTLSGIKSKEHHARGYGELLFDDTQEQIRTKLSSEHGKTQVNQGYLIHPRQNGRGEARGEGLELRTDRQAAVRAAEGLLLSTEARLNASGKQLDRDAAREQLEAARTNARKLSDIAEQQSAHPTEIGPQTRDEEGQAQGEAQQGHLDHMVEAVKAWEAGTNTDPKGQSAGAQPGKQGVLLVSGAAGVGLTTPEEMILASGGNLDTVSLRDTQQTTLRRWLHQAGKKISLFVLGVADKINLSLITAKGHAQLQAQSGDVEISGDKNVRIYAVKEKFVVAAGEEALITCGGAYIRLKDGNVEINAPNTLLFRGSRVQFTGPASLEVDKPGFKKPADIDFYSERFQLKNEKTGKPIPNTLYCVEFGDGRIVTGHTDKKGYTLRTYASNPKDVRVLWGRDAETYLQDRKKHQGD